MRLARLAAASLLSLSIATAASAVEVVPLAAIVTSGLTDGATMMVSGFGNGPVADLGSGAFEVTFDKGVIKFLFVETDTCFVNLHGDIPGQGAVEVRYDLTKMTGIKIDDRGQFEGLNAAIVTIEGDDVVQVLIQDNWVTQPGFAFLVGSLTAADYQAAADELQRVC
jgi:hypothetical protein